MTGFYVASNSYLGGIAATPLSFHGNCLHCSSCSCKGKALGQKLCRAVTWNCTCGVAFTDHDVPCDARTLELPHAFDTILCNTGRVSGSVASLQFVLHTMV